MQKYDYLRDSPNFWDILQDSVTDGVKCCSFLYLCKHKTNDIMPRKTDGIEFEIHPRPTKGEDGKPLLYVRPAKGRKKSFKDLEDFCNKYRNLRPGEMQMVFDVMMDVVGNWLSDGYRVETPIGSFAPKLKLLGEHTDPNTIHGRDIEYAGIEFIPSKEFIKEAGKNRHRIKLGFGRPFQYKRPGAPIYTGARPNLYGRPPESVKMPSFTLQHAVSHSVSPYFSH